MKTRYEMLTKAGDLLCDVCALLREANEPDLRTEAHKLLKSIYTAQDAAWRPEYAEPELERS